LTFAPAPGRLLNRLTSQPLPPAAANRRSGALAGRERKMIMPLADEVRTVGHMRITFRRFPDHSSAYPVIERDDGVVYRMKEFTRAGTELPHDLRHFVVERELGITDGIWGGIAAGPSCSRTWSRLSRCSTTRRPGRSVGSPRRSFPRYPLPSQARTLPP
jgi:hypothetical protein